MSEFISPLLSNISVAYKTSRVNTSVRSFVDLALMKLYQIVKSQPNRKKVFSLISKNVESLTQALRIFRNEKSVINVIENLIEDAIFHDSIIADFSSSFTIDNSSDNPKPSKMQKTNKNTRNNISNYTKEIFDQVKKVVFDIKLSVASFSIIPVLCKLYTRRLGTQVVGLPMIIMKEGKKRKLALTPENKTNTFAFFSEMYLILKKFIEAPIEDQIKDENITVAAWQAMNGLLLNLKVSETTGPLLETYTDHLIQFLRLDNNYNLVVPQAIVQQVFESASHILFLDHKLIERHFGVFILAYWRFPYNDAVSSKSSKKATTVLQKHDKFAVSLLERYSSIRQVDILIFDLILNNLLQSNCEVNFFYHPSFWDRFSHVVRLLPVGQVPIIWDRFNKIFNKTFEQLLSLQIKSDESSHVIESLNSSIRHAVYLFVTYMNSIIVLESNYRKYLDLVNKTENELLVPLLMPIFSEIQSEQSLTRSSRFALVAGLLLYLSIHKFKASCNYRFFSINNLPVEPPKELLNPGKYGYTGHDANEYGSPSQSSAEDEMNIDEYQHSSKVSEMLYEKITLSKLYDVFVSVNELDDGYDFRYLINALISQRILSIYSTINRFSNTNYQSIQRNKFREELSVLSSYLSRQCDELHDLASNYINNIDSVDSLFTQDNVGQHSDVGRVINNTYKWDKNENLFSMNRSSFWVAYWELVSQNLVVLSEMCYGHPALVDSIIKCLLLLGGLGVAEKTISNHSSVENKHKEDIQGLLDVTFRVFSDPSFYENKIVNERIIPVFCSMSSSSVLSGSLLMNPQIQDKNIQRILKKFKNCSKKSLTEKTRSKVSMLVGQYSDLVEDKVINEVKLNSSVFEKSWLISEILASYPPSSFQQIFSLEDQSLVINYLVLLDIICNRYLNNPSSPLTTSNTVMKLYLRMTTNNRKLLMRLIDQLDLHQYFTPSNFLTLCHHIPNRIATNRRISDHTTDQSELMQYFQISNTQLIEQYARSLIYHITIPAVQSIRRKQNVVQTNELTDVNVYINHLSTFFEIMMDKLSNSQQQEDSRVNLLTINIFITSMLNKYNEVLVEYQGLARLNKKSKKKNNTNNTNDSKLSIPQPIANLFTKLENHVTTRLFDVGNERFSENEVCLVSSDSNLASIKFLAVDCLAQLLRYHKIRSLITIDSQSASKEKINFPLLYIFKWIEHSFSHEPSPATIRNQGVSPKNEKYLQSKLLLWLSYITESYHLFQPRFGTDQMSYLLAICHYLYIHFKIHCKQNSTDMVLLLDHILANFIHYSDKDGVKFVISYFQNVIKKIVSTMKSSDMDKQDAELYDKLSVALHCTHHSISHIKGSVGYTVINGISKNLIPVLTESVTLLSESLMYSKYDKKLPSVIPQSREQLDNICKVVNLLNMIVSNKFVKIHSTELVVILSSMEGFLKLEKHYQATLKIFREKYPNYHDGALLQLIVSFDPVCTFAIDYSVYDCFYHLLYSLIRIRPDETIKCFASFMACVQYLLFQIPKISTAQLDTLEMRANSLSRLYQSIAEHKKKTKKIAVYVIADFVNLLRRQSMNQIAKASLLPGIYSLIDICGDYELKQLITILGETGRALFKTLYSDYTNNYKFTGMV
eukprot:TRINITY_DN9584_c0_g1_i1.p1 TRINITY_DN9584_c0_g1~~TRINITY_DN9584_c0_g1_i1.p1  ORF type:complete len:1760 (-),score=272.52 TRINITY_DN9584_c0_g1_i1:190-5019(-)